MILNERGCSSSYVSQDRETGPHAGIAADARLPARNRTVPIVPLSDLIPGATAIQGELQTPLVVSSSGTVEMNSHCIELFPDRGSLLRFTDQVVVDLGAGSSVYGYRLAMLSGARAYVAVDAQGPFLDKMRRSLEQEIFEAEFDFTRFPNCQGSLIPAALVKTDFISALEALPNNSVSPMMCAIDGHIIQRETARQAVYQELKRVLHPEGAIVMFNCDLDLKGLQKESIGRNIEKYTK